MHAHRARGHAYMQACMRMRIARAAMDAHRARARAAITVERALHTSFFKITIK
eukprot:SAG31_NODE_2143_length_6342_cov_5.402531_1_plen_53_part_00